MIELPPLWPHQSRGLGEVYDLIAEGVHRILYVSPTGGGKTRSMLELIRWARLRDWGVLLLTNRRMLLEQTKETLAAAGIEFGVRAAGHKPHLDRDVQLSSIGTEISRVYDSREWLRHPAKLVLVDERHEQKGEEADTLLRDYALDGAFEIGFTATPLGLDGKAEALVVAGDTAELRRNGSLLWAHCYAPDEPTAKALRSPDGTFTEPSVRAAMMAAKDNGDPVVYGRILENWKRLNPEGKPTIAFGPGVPESLYLAQRCSKDGVPSAHIDGDNIWLNGEWLTATQSNREKLRDASETGWVKIVWNRLVMRTGIDWTHLYHGILATVFGGLTSYLQSVGRLLRAHPGMDHVILQDHGGNWHRFGSPNESRVWDLKMTDRIALRTRERRLRDKLEPEPIACPKCHALRLWGRQCPECGWFHTTRPRFVIETDGTLREAHEALHKPRRITEDPADFKAWERAVWRCRNSGKTFLQAEALFAKENYGRYPPRSWDLMPIREADWFQRVEDVPASRLTGVPKR